MLTSTVVRPIEISEISADGGRETEYEVMAGNIASESVLLMLTLQLMSFKHCSTLNLVPGLSTFTDPSSSNVVRLNRVWTSYSGRTILGQHKDIMVQVQDKKKDSLRVGEKLRIDKRLASINPSLQ